MLHKKTINEFDLQDKHILLRADYNVPIAEGKITSNYRITQSIPTIRALQGKGCKIVICAHLGRPKSPNDKHLSLKPIAKELSRLLGEPILFANDCIGQKVKETAEKLHSREILLLENLRFYPEEEANDRKFAEQLVESNLAEVFVQDAFGDVHRVHASIDMVPRIIPAVAGLLLEKEYNTITGIMENPTRPLLAIVGGAKIADKIDIIHKFIEIADVVALGGAMANTFLLAQGVEVGESLVDKDELDIANDVINKAREQAKKRNFIFYIPQDGVVSTKIDSKTTTRIVDWEAHVIADIEAYPGRPKIVTSKVEKDEEILDIGPYSGAFISGIIQLANTVVWNGTMGVSEVKAIHGPIGPFAHGTEAIIDALVGKYGNRPFSLLGGGDTTGYIEQRGLTDMFNHVSTGGGSCLELIAGKDLPGVHVLWDK